MRSVSTDKCPFEDEQERSLFPTPHILLISCTGCMGPPGQTNRVCFAVDLFHLDDRWMDVTKLPGRSLLFYCLICEPLKWIILSANIIFLGLGTMWITVLLTLNYKVGLMFSKPNITISTGPFVHSLVDSGVLLWLKMLNLRYFSRHEISIETPDVTKIRTFINLIGFVQSCLMFFTSRERRRQFFQREWKKNCPLWFALV